MGIGKLALLGVSLFGSIVLALPSLVFSAPEVPSDDKTLSPYFYVQSDDSTDQMPLKSTAADVVISGVIADVEVTQVYKNEGKNTLEAIYIFPGSTRAAVYAMRMTIGKRTFDAKIQEREQARHTYEQALSEGKTASLLEQQRPNVFQMNVGNILPGDEITVRLNYTELLVPEDATYEFVYPTVVGPRYSNKSEADAGHQDKWVANPYLEEGKPAPFPFTFSCRINSGIPIARLTSPSHEIDVEYTGKVCATIKLKPGSAADNRDVVIRYCLAGNSIESGLLMNIGKQEDFFLLMLEPPERVDAAIVVPREYVFILDVSGSMNGFPLGVAKTLIKDLLGKLRESDLFNVVLFAGDNTTLSENSLPVTPANLQKALDVIDRQRGGGGTELLPALRAAMALPAASENVSRSFVIITDGFVDVEKDAFDYIRSNLRNGNVFTFGIGSSVNRFLIEGMARAGMGEPFIALNHQEAQTVADRFRKYIDSPVLTDINVIFDGLQVSEMEPASIPDLFAKKPVILFGKYRGTPKSTITITGKAAGKPYRKEIRVSEGEVSTKNNALRYLWARHRIISLADMVKLSKDGKRIAEITQLGLTYNLLTDYTSFVAVDTEIRTQGKPQNTVKQPLPLPEGVSNAAVGGQETAKYKNTRTVERFKSKEAKLDSELEPLKKQLEVMEARAETNPVPQSEPTKPAPLPMEPQPDQPKDKRQQLMEKIKKLEQQKMENRKTVSEKANLNKPVGKSLSEIVARYEKLLANCTVKKTERCADVIYTLGGLYYDKGRDDYIAAREIYEQKMTAYTQDSIGPEPVNPVPDYSQALRMYESLIAEYPVFPKLSEAYYQMGTIYLLMGDLIKSKEMFTIVCEKYPRSPRASGGHFRLNNICCDNDSCAVKHLEKINQSEVDIQTWEMVHYRKAEMYYNLKEFDKAATLFQTYIDKCDSGLYPKCEFRDMAIEFLGICFSDMEDGYKKAFALFKKIGPRPYEPDVFRTIGTKYESKGKPNDAANALYRAGMFYYAAQQWDKAANCFKRVDELYRAAIEAKKKPILNDDAISDVRQKLAEIEQRKK